MELRAHITLLLFGILGITYAQDFYVAAPSILRLNSDEIIAIAVDSPNTVTVNVIVQDYPQKSKTLFQDNVPVPAGQPKTHIIKLNPAQFPPGFLSAPGNPKLVSLNVQVQNRRREILIPITSQSGYMFIQTDKPIYTPLERVAFRIIPLTEEGLPSNERYRLQIKNPDNITVDEKSYNRGSPNYFGTHTYKFPTHPKLGEWTAVVRYGNNLEQTSSVTFELEEYVLPTFTVRLQTPDVILPNHNEITVEVQAKHVYGRNVNGIASFRFGVKREHSPEAVFFKLDSPKALLDGALTVTMSTNELKRHQNIGWFPTIEGSIFVVEVTVVDDATGNKVVEIDSKGRFSKSPFIISFKRCLSDFKPGLPSVFEADITYVGGKPATGIATKLSATADNGRPMNIIQSTSTSNENGVVHFEIHPENHHKTVTLTLETTQDGYAGNQAKGTFMQQAYESGNKAYIAISRSSPLRLRPGDAFGRDIHLEPKGIQNIYYMVVAKGKIQKIAKLPQGAYKVQRIEFTITYDMVPSFRVIAFAHYRNDLVVDSLKFDVEKICSPKAEVTLDPVFDQKEPGRGGVIIMRGVKDTSVGLLGVDEAVYALSRKGLLTKDKMFDRFASHDLGCGPGGGVNVNTVLGNAGILIGTNHFAPSHTHSCVQIKRKKRSLVKDIVSQYTGREQACCSLGLRPDAYNRDCEDRYYAAEESLDAIHENCSRAFLDCCMNAAEQKVTATVIFPDRLVGDNQDALQFLDPEMEDEFESQTTVRRDFRETWINFNYRIGSDNKREVNISLPHSITTWVLQAVSVSPTDGMCVSEPKKLVSFKKIFLHLSLPYSIKLYEQVEIQATVFNYVDKKLTVYVYMYGVEGVCSGTEAGVKSERKKLQIKGKSAETVTFSVIPLRVEDFPIKIVALSTEGSDVIEKKLHVVPRGVREEENAVIRLDPTNRQKRAKRHIDEKLYTDSIDPSQNLQVTALKMIFPEGTVAGSTKCSIKATGDIVGPSVETTLRNPDGLIQMPSGCGEQNMIRFAPTIYTMKYLKSSDNLTPDRRNKGIGFIRSGYDNELKYRKKDGSYSVWAHTPTSTWLTAFVMKVFCQATDFIPIDKNVISSGIGWLVKNQQTDGSYIERNKVYHKEMMGGVDGTVSMTAFALIALEECRNNDQSLLQPRQQAVAFLEGRRNTVQTPLPAAILAYALALADSTVKGDANEKLLAMAKYDPNNNFLYWTTPNSAQDIETAGYALLTQLLLNDITRSSSIVNWLNTKQLQSGQFKSTQDTVIALQALSEYATKAPVMVVNLMSNITSSRDKTFNKAFRFNKDNALELQTVQIENPDGIIFVRTSGTGMGTLSMNLQYTVIKPEHEVCKFEIKETVSEVQNMDRLLRGVLADLGKDPNSRRRRQANSDKPARPLEIDAMKDLSLNVKLCVRYLGNGSTEMSIVDVGIFSGFEPVVKDLEGLVREPNHLIERYEKSSRGVVFYLKEVPKTKDYCFSFRVYREYVVGNTQSSVIKVYDYYNPDAVCTKFYSPKEGSALINTICDGGVCQCAEGGCPSKEPFAELLKESTVSRRDKMIKMFCDDYDYVWKGRLKGRLGMDGKFLNITFAISEVVKAGIESKENVEKKTRSLRAQDHCQTAQLFPGAMYLIMGKDPPSQEEGNTRQYIYLLDKSSIIQHWTSTAESANKDLQRDLNHVTDRLKETGCEL